MFMLLHRCTLENIQIILLLKLILTTPIIIFKNYFYHNYLLLYTFIASKNVYDTLNFKTFCPTRRFHIKKHFFIPIKLNIKSHIIARSVLMIKVLPKENVYKCVT